MRLFEKIEASAKSGQAYTLPEATCGLLLAVMACDGNVAVDELAYFYFVTERHPIFRLESPTVMSRTIDRMTGALNRSGWKSLVDKCVINLPAEVRLPVFALAVEFVFADGIVEREEEEMICYLQRAFGIADEIASSIVEVLALKNGFLSQGYLVKQRD